MPLDITCPHCSARFETPDSFAGKMGKCPMCGEAFRAPEAPRSGGSSILPKSGALPRAKPLAGDSAPSNQPAPPQPAPAPAKAPPRRKEAVVAEVIAEAPVDDAPAFQPIITARPSATVPVTTTPSGPLPAATAPGAASGPIRPPTPQVGIPIWGWLVGGVALVGLLAAGVFVVSNMGTATTPGGSPASGPVGVVPRKPGLFDKAKGKGGPTLAVDLTKPHVVQNMKDAAAAVVKIVSPFRRGGSQGSGFIIDRRGWIATNFHVIEGASANTRVHMEDGNVYELEGLIAADSTLDMAIVKLKNPPIQLTVFELQSSPEPERASEIFCYGNPLGVDFTVVNGIIGRVLRSRDLDPGGQQLVIGQMKAKGDMLWIQHNAKIYPGNSGGPLIDKKTMKVIGINTWVNREVDFGYAGHIRYLQQMIADATDTIKPYPPERQRPRYPWELPEEEPEEGPNPTRPNPSAPPPPVAMVLPVRDISAAKMIKQFEDCEKLKWQPTNAAGYEKLSELGRLLVTARELAINEDLLPSLEGEDRKSVIDTGEQVLKKLAAVDWSGEKPNNMSRLAVDALDKAGSGIVAVARRLPGQSGRPTLMLFDLEGTPVLAEMPESIAEKTKEGRTLIVGMATPIEIAVNIPDVGSAKIKVVRVNYTLPLEE